ncbi:hypothetical protein FRX94_07225 [Corynebacterium canis]|uniref:Uncharacterized protein n=1 Tax=Corynebacterium canis TaxID=679663 RepID=A0A5C5UGU8_9CORY|nr:hypothetical protein [Corynebacterium canis]TWT25047.1 hypothetical protein FRX94_07225 [Corynebacterium canis]WJY76070.1 hypothetical protein CCANI_11255 [Corynebacterium canis]
MLDRYKEMGLERLPTKRYMVDSEHGTPGTAWIYRGARGFGAVCFDDIDVLRSGGEQEFHKCTDWDLANRIQGLANDCAKRDLSIPQALEHIREVLGAPVLVVPLKNINEADADLVPAVKSILDSE